MSNKARFAYIRMLAVIVLLGFIFGAFIEDSDAATPGNCRYTGYTNAWSKTDANDDLLELIENASWYPTRHCHNGGARIFHTQANTKHEVGILRGIFKEDTYGEESGIPEVFCVESKKHAYLMGELWIFQNVKISGQHKQRWNAFAQTWVSTHTNCTLGK